MNSASDIQTHLLFGQLMKVQIHSLTCSCSGPAVSLPSPSFAETGYDLHP